jgi:hypothetical protein
MGNPQSVPSGDFLGLATHVSYTHQLGHSDALRQGLIL